MHSDFSLNTLLILLVPNGRKRGISKHSLLILNGGLYNSSKGKDQPGKVVNPARAQLNRENELFPVPVRA